MSNRFAKKKLDKSIIKRIAAFLLFFAVLIFVYYGIGYLDKTSEKDALKSANDALACTVVQCYSIEGRYPPDKEYMKSEYGLNIDTNKYIVHYVSNGGNILPDYKVMKKG